MDSASQAAPAPSLDPELRLLHSLEEYTACVRLQKETWGRDFNEVVPATILKITNRVGGIVAGAFDGERLVAFVYGITGLERGRLVHWSHMLAVDVEYRDRGIGRKLKEFQRELLGRRGVETILWSYDPLVARNAHLNLNRLGARVDEYVVDMYPGKASDLHAFGTDRLIVAWPTGRLPLPLPLPSSEDSPLVTGSEPETFNPPAVRIAVPPDIEAIAAAAAGEALAWRTATRRAFTAWLGRGYTITGFRRDPAGCYYTLSAPVPRASEEER